MIGLGLMVVSRATTIVAFALGWCIIGVGMAGGLYDALFATLGRRYGAQARGAIMQVTLIAGFCTTVTWPLVSALVHGHGWRTACLLYGLLLWVSVWPINRLGLPAASAAAADAAPPPSAAAEPHVSATLSRLLAVQFTIGAIAIGPCRCS